MKTILINLKRQPERRAYAMQECMRAGLHPDVLEATDARRFTAEWIERNATLDLRHKLEDASYHSMNPGALACADSHRRAWNQLLISNDFPSLVLEDDFFWLASPSAVRRTLSAASRADFDLVLLGYSPRHPISKDCLVGVPTGTGHVVVPYEKVKRTSGSYAYLLNQRGAECLSVAQRDAVDREADDFALEQERQGKAMKVGVLFPPLVHHGVFDSSIWTTASPTLRQKVKRWLNTACVRSIAVREVFAWAMLRRLKVNYVERRGDPL